MSGTFDFDLDRSAASRAALQHAAGALGVCAAMVRIAQLPDPAASSLSRLFHADARVSERAADVVRELGADLETIEEQVRAADLLQWHAPTSTAATTVNVAAGHRPGAGR